VTGQFVGVHRTFMRAHGAGKADGQSKMMLGGAGVVRLYEWMGDGLGLTEGIESALAIAQHFEWQPVWAACSAAGVRNFPALRFHALSVFADNDRAGQDAARMCAQRWAEAGNEVHLRYPPAGDWDDAKGLLP
jgi:putative DNA primase/helicase